MASEHPHVVDTHTLPSSRSLEDIVLLVGIHDSVYLESMEEVSLNTDPVVDDDADEFEIEGDCEMAECVRQSGVIQGENPLPPVVGMEFDSYEDVYYFYNCYAKEQGFGVRVSNTWYRKSKERYRGKLGCSIAGFKKKSETNRPRPETRTGCPAMIKFRVMDNKSPVSGKFYKSHKQLGLGTKRALQIDSAEEVQKLRVFRTVIVDVEGNGSAEVSDGELQTAHNQTNQLRLKNGDAQAIHNYFSHLQLIDPNFFYVLDLNEKGCLRNLFWTSARSRVAYGYFGDVVAINRHFLLNGQIRSPTGFVCWSESSWAVCAFGLWFACR
ncbi:protein FAR1-RELATED SEQUENCE 6-like [Hibiscus syriacus]|uniref:protein FAR1-RELATED SEQUENCE 6-like n=1 Tax=Hibiscus syriacus TaxID=106335 RepID=UPI001921C568|nr:protein FAR1-RELATED SEQUENCE 6-like [Hibiscus syriacus]